MSPELTYREAWIIHRYFTFWDNKQTNKHIHTYSTKGAPYSTTTVLKKRHDSRKYRQDLNNLLICQRNSKWNSNYESHRLFLCIVGEHFAHLYLVAHCVFLCWWADAKKPKHCDVDHSNRSSYTIQPNHVGPINREVFHKDSRHHSCHEDGGGNNGMSRCHAPDLNIPHYGG